MSDLFKLKSMLMPLLSIILLSGCATANLTKKGINYDQKLSHIKTISVLPVDFKISQINASGVPEEMDEWANNIKNNIKEDIKQIFHGRNLEAVFVNEADLKSKGYDIWLSQKGLFDAITYCSLMHAYPGGFESKIKNYDYTMGPDIQKLSALTTGEALLFIYGFDNVRTTGRLWLEAFQGALLGVYYYYYSGLSMGLVDANTGEVLWFKTNGFSRERDYRNPKLVKKDIEWLLEDFLVKK